jgi:hypothetical protein
MKKQLTLILLLSSFIISAPALAQNESARGKSTGLGFILGEPSGFSFQFRANQPQTINGGLAWSFDHWFQIWGDYVWHFPRFVSDVIQDYTAMDAYIGIGGGLIFAESRHFGNKSFGVLMRVPLGLEYKLTRPSLGFFLEIVPGIVFGPSTSGKLQGGLGARFYF